MTASELRVAERSARATRKFDACRLARRAAPTSPAPAVGGRGALARVDASIEPGSMTTEPSDRAAGQRP